MADQIRRVDYFYTHVADNPGEGFKLVSQLKEAGINLLAFTAFPSPGSKAQVDFVPENPEAFLAAAQKAGISLSSKKQGFLITGDDRTGAVADTLKRLSEAKINITAMDAVCAGNGRYGAILWVKPTSLDAAARALGV